jgi:hypothetical protein
VGDRLGAMQIEQPAHSFSDAKVSKSCPRAIGLWSHRGEPKPTCANSKTNVGQMNPRIHI